ncbi:odorant receptor Or1-like [Tribolium castaneum]|uniref:odorant receptor Or1-like n=1 Tax=Tribolium castaneum TaxID=7070 RepID=UPI0030FDFAF0
MKQIVKPSFRIHLTLMQILGFYPTRSYKKLYKLYAYFVYCFLTIPVPTLATVYLLVEDNIDLLQLSNSGFLICQIGCFIAKFVPFWKKPEKIKRSIYMLENQIFTNHAPEQCKIIDDCIRICNRDCWLNLALVLSALTSWAVTPIAKGISKLPVEMWLPYDVNKDDKTYYLTYLFVVTGTANGAIASGVIDPLIAGLACQATGQLRILKNNLQYLWENVDKEISDSEKDNALREKIMYDKIRSCILHHNSILNYVELFEDTYSSVVFTQFTASVLVICNACLQISMKNFTDDELKHAFATLWSYYYIYNVVIVTNTTNFVTWYPYKRKSFAVKSPFEKNDPGYSIRYLNTIGEKLNLEVVYLTKNIDYIALAIKTGNWTDLIQHMKQYKIDIAPVFENLGGTYKEVEWVKPFYQAGLASHATTQLKILKNNLQFLSEDADQVIAQQLTKARIIQDKIRFCIIHHNAILDFVDYYENVYSGIVFSQFIASVFVEPFSVIFFAMVIFLVTVLSQIFLYSYYGTLLFEENNTLTNAVYMGQWYTYDVTSRKALIILMERSKRPMTVRAGKVLDLSLETFTTILRRAYSLLAVLKNY